MVQKGEIAFAGTLVVILALFHAIQWPFSCTHIHEDQEGIATAHAVEHEHTAEAIRDRLAAEPPQSYLRDVVYGGIDGVISTFAIVSGVAGAHLAPGIVSILGGASLIADGFAMAAGNYLATTAERDEFRHAESVEHRHIDTFPEGEQEEVREILRRIGIPADLVDKAAASITADRDRWVRIMVRDEYGLPTTVRSPSRAASATFFAFLICGIVPLLPFIAGLGGSFWIAAGAAGVVFVSIGALKSRWSVRPWWQSGLMTLAVGGGAAGLAFAVGYWLRRLAG